MISSFHNFILWIEPFYFMNHVLHSGPVASMGQAQEIAPPIRVLPAHKQILPRSQRKPAFGNRAIASLDIY